MGYLQLPGIGQAHYHEYGEGTKPLLAFHGYGMTGRQFHVLKQSVLKEYHVYGFDHFFHGKSRLDNWTEKQITTGMTKIMVRLYAEEWFKQHGEQRISVMGYSIGANIALVLVEEYAHLIDDVILMAPDGLSVFKGFDFLTNHQIGKRLFSRLTKSKWLAPGLLKSLKKLGLVDDSLFNIAYNEIDTAQKRQDVYYTLNLIKHIKPNVEKVTTLINEHHIRCKLIFGRDDNLFPYKAALPFITKLKNPEIHELPLGHWLVTTVLDDYLVSLKHDTTAP